MLTALIMFSGCSLATSCDKDSALTEEQKEVESVKETGEVSLLYMGQASIRIVTEAGRVIYIDPYAGNQYDLAADLILVTHEHFDHNKLSLVRNRGKDCRIIRAKDAVTDEGHQRFDLGYVSIQVSRQGSTAGTT